MASCFDVLKVTSDNHINLYPLSDLHIGSQEFNLKAYKKWETEVLSDPFSRVVLLGDICNNGLKTSKTNSYEETMSPRSQKLYAVDLFAPIAHKIDALIDGNHEYRSRLVADDSPTEDIAHRLGLIDKYRSEAVFLKYSCGHRTKDRQYTYMVGAWHGKSPIKSRNMGLAVEGLDLLITGHTHNPEEVFPAKLVLDPHNECVSVRSFARVVCPSFLEYGGYGLRDMYLPTANDRYPVITFNSDGKRLDCHNYQF